MVRDVDLLSMYSHSNFSCQDAALVNGPCLVWWQVSTNWGSSCFQSSKVMIAPVPSILAANNDKINGKINSKSMSK